MVQSPYSVGLISRGWKLGAGEGGGGIVPDKVSQKEAPPRSLTRFPFTYYLDRNAKAFKSKWVEIVPHSYEKWDPFSNPTGMIIIEKLTKKRIFYSLDALFRALFDI